MKKLGLYRRLTMILGLHARKYCFSIADIFERARYARFTPLTPAYAYHVFPLGPITTAQRRYYAADAAYLHIARHISQEADALLKYRIGRARYDNHYRGAAWPATEKVNIDWTACMIITVDDRMTYKRSR